MGSSVVPALLLVVHGAATGFDVIHVGPSAAVRLSRPAIDGVVGADVTGLRLWPSAVPLASHLHESVLPALRARADRPLRILELGAGRGLVGLAISALNAREEIVLTDDGGSFVTEGGVPRSAVDVLRANIALNGAGARRASAAALRWGDEAELARLQRPTFDVCVGSDLLYDPSSYVELLRTLEACGCDAHIAATRRHEGERAFFALAQRRFKLVARRPLRWPAGVSKPDDGMFVVPRECVRRGERLRGMVAGFFYGRQRAAPAPKPPPHNCSEAEWAAFEAVAVGWACDRQCAVEEGWRTAGRGDEVIHLKSQTESNRVRRYSVQLIACVHTQAPRPQRIWCWRFIYIL